MVSTSGNSGTLGRRYALLPLWPLLLFLGDGMHDGNFRRHWRQRRRRDRKRVLHRRALDDDSSERGLLLRLCSQDEREYHERAECRQADSDPELLFRHCARGGSPRRSFEKRLEVFGKTVHIVGTIEIRQGF
jgi:hypothetical protein